MKSQFINLNEAASLINKSTQTLRRLIKSNKIKYRRRKTPQGFIYFIDISSLRELFSKYLNGNALLQISSLEDSADPIDINNQSIQELLPEYDLYSTTHSEPINISSHLIADNESHDSNIECPTPSMDRSYDKSSHEDFFVINSGQMNLMQGKNIESNHTHKNPTSLYHDNEKYELINQHIEHVHLKIRNCGAFIVDFPYISDINTVLINQLENKIQTLSHILDSAVKQLQKAENIFYKVSKKWWQFWK